MPISRLRSILFVSVFCITIQNAAAVTVYTAGDIVDCRSKESAARSVATAKIINEEIKKNPQAIVLTLGDHTYPVGTTEEFETCYEPTWGKFKNRTYPTPGNHEYYTPEAYPYYQYFGKAAGSQKKSYYSFNKGSWHIISLNSNFKEKQQKEQLAWLAEDLKKNRSSCILAFWHHPVYSSGLHGNNSKMTAVWDRLMTAKADLVLTGHDHFYERFALQDSQGNKHSQSGIREFIIGTGGADLTPTLRQRKNSEVLKTKVNGILKLNLKKRGYDWEFLAVPGSNFTDKGSAVCHRK